MKNLTKIQKEVRKFGDNLKEKDVAFVFYTFEEEGENHCQLVHSHITKVQFLNFVGQLCKKADISKEDVCTAIDFFKSENKMALIMEKFLEMLKNKK